MTIENIYYPCLFGPKKDSRGRGNF